MEDDKLVTKSKLRQRVTSCFKWSSFDPKRLRGGTMGALVNSTFAEVTGYILIKKSIAGGDLPDYTADLMIVILACLEAILSPFLSWWSFRSRRNTYIIAQVACTVVVILLATPNIDIGDSTELCSLAHVPFAMRPLTGKVVLRVLIVTVIAITFMLARLSTLPHSIAQIDDHSPHEIMTHLGILLAARTLALTMCIKMIGPVVETSLWTHTTIMLLGTVNNVIQLFRIPADVDLEITEKIHSHGRGLVESVGRVLCNKTAVSQMLAIAFLAAALWGFAFHEKDIVLQKYNIDVPENFLTTYADILRFHVIIIMILFYANTYAPPIMARFEKLKAIRFGATLSTMLVFLYVVVVMFFCTKGQVTGLQGSSYQAPSCSLACGRCSATSNKLSPVCVVEQMSTYLSPCHAGCSAMEEMGGIQFYSNCTCAGFGRATIGSCSERSCNNVMQLHNIVFAVIITMTVVAFQMHVVSLLRAVDPRDKSVAIGVTGSFVAIIAFVFAQCIFVAIKRTTCLWYEGYQCNLHSSTFSYLIGATCATFASLAAIISFTISFLIRNDEKENESDSQGIDIDR